MYTTFETATTTDSQTPKEELNVKQISKSADIESEPSITTAIPRVYGTNSPAEELHAGQLSTELTSITPEQTSKTGERNTTAALQAATYTGYEFRDTSVGSTTEGSVEKIEIDKEASASIVTAETTWEPEYITQYISMTYMTTQSSFTDTSRMFGGKKATFPIIKISHEPIIPTESVASPNSSLNTGMSAKTASDLVETTSTFLDDFNNKKETIYGEKLIMSANTSHTSVLMTDELKATTAFPEVKQDNIKTSIVTVLRNKITKTRAPKTTTETSTFSSNVREFLVETSRNLPKVKFQTFPENKSDVVGYVTNINTITQPRATLLNMKTSTMLPEVVNGNEHLALPRSDMSKTMVEISTKSFDKTVNKSFGEDYKLQNHTSVHLIIKSSNKTDTSMKFPENEYGFLDTGRTYLNIPVAGNTGDSNELENILHRNVTISNNIKSSFPYVTSILTKSTSMQKVNATVNVLYPETTMSEKETIPNLLETTTPTTATSATSSETTTATMPTTSPETTTATIATSTTPKTTTTTIATSTSPKATTTTIATSTSPKTTTTTIATTITSPETTTTTMQTTSPETTTTIETSSTSPKSSKSKMETISTSPETTTTTIQTNTTSPETTTPITETTRTSLKTTLTTMQTTTTSPKTRLLKMEITITLPKMIMTTIETSKTSPETTMTTIETSKTSPETTMTTIETSKTSPETTMTTIETSKTSPETTMTTIETSKTSPETTMTTIETSKTSPETTMTTIETSKTSPETTMTTIETSKTSPETTMTTIETSKTSPETTMTTIETIYREQAALPKITNVTTEIIPDLPETTTTTMGTTTTLLEMTTLPENYNTVKMSDVTSFTFENSTMECNAKYAIKWKSLSIKINQKWRPLEVTLYPSGEIHWSSSKTRRHGVTFDVKNNADGSGSNISLGLIIHDVQCRDGKTYICTLKSELEDRVARSDLIVVGKPGKKISLTFGPSIIENKAFRITASWQGGYPIPWANMSWTAVDANNNSYDLSEYGDYRDYELHEDHKFCQTTLKHSIVVFPKVHLNDTRVIVKPNIQLKKFFVTSSMEKYLENVEPGMDTILVIPLNYCNNGRKEMSITHPYTRCSKFIRCLPGDMVVQACPVGTCFSKVKHECV